MFEQFTFTTVAIMWETNKQNQKGVPGAAMRNMYASSVYCRNKTLAAASVKCVFVALRWPS